MTADPTSRTCRWRGAAAPLAPLLAALLASGCAMTNPVGQAMLAVDVLHAAVTGASEIAAERRARDAEAERARGLGFRMVAARAARGDARSQYELGLYYQGEKMAEAERWICAAAAQGHARAQLQLGHWYNEDRRSVDPWPYIDITPDDRSAWRWYAHAARGGDEEAALFRDRVAGRSLSPAQVAVAGERFASAPTPRCSSYRPVLASEQPFVAR